MLNWLQPDLTWTATNSYNEIEPGRPEFLFVWSSRNDGDLTEISLLSGQHSQIMLLKYCSRSSWVNKAEAPEQESALTIYM